MTWIDLKESEPKEDQEVLIKWTFPIETVWSAESELTAIGSKMKHVEYEVLKWKKNRFEIDTTHSVIFLPFMTHWRAIDEMD